MGHALSELGPPHGEVFRIGRRGDPLSPPPWDKALVDDGTFGNRFDDPSAAEGRPPEDRFRCLYCGTTEEVAFAECLTGKRVPMRVLAKLAAIDDDEPVEKVLAGAEIDIADPKRPRGLVTAEWQSRHQIGRTLLHSGLRFANIATKETAC